MRWVWESRLEASVGSMSYIKHAVSWSNLPQKIREKYSGDA